MSKPKRTVMTVEKLMKELEPLNPKARIDICFDYNLMQQLISDGHGQFPDFYVSIEHHDDAEYTANGGSWGYVELCYDDYTHELMNQHKENPNE